MNQEWLNSLSVCVAEYGLDRSLELTGNITPYVAKKACQDEHRMLVEPACGAALAAGYSGIIQELISKDIIHKDGPIVFVVCGGNVVTLELLEAWMNQFK